MVIDLPDDLRSYVEDQVATGLCPTAGEFIQELIRRHRHDVAADALERRLLAALDGPSSPADVALERIHIEFGRRVEEFRRRKESA